MTSPSAGSEGAPVAHVSQDGHAAALVVLARFPLRPGTRAQVLGLTRAMTEATREDPGCLDFGFSESLDEDDVLVANESWASEREFLDHLRRPHTLSFQEELTPFLLTPGTIRRYDVSAVHLLG